MTTRTETEIAVLSAGVKAYQEYLATCSPKDPGFMLNAMQAARVAMEDEFQSHPYLFSLAANFERCTLDIEGAPHHYTRDEEVDALRAELEVLRTFSNEMLGVAFEGGSLDGANVQDIGVRCGVLTVHEVEVRCGEILACAEYDFPTECYRKTSVTQGRDATVSTHTQNLMRQE